MAALGAYRRLVLDLDGDHLEDARGAAAERFALLQFDAARYRLPAAAARQAAGARCVEARILSHGDDGDQAAASLDGDAPRAAADRTGKTRELLSEGRVTCSPDCASLHPGDVDNSLQRRMRRRQHDGRMHLLEEARALAEKLLPGRVLHRVAA